MPSVAPRLLVRRGDGRPGPGSVLVARAESPSVPRPPSRARLRPKFQPQKQFPEGAGSGGEAVAGLACERLSESARTRRDRDSTVARLSGHVHNFAPPGGGRRGAGRGRAAGAGTSAPEAAGGFASPRERRDARVRVQRRAPSAKSRGWAAAAAPGSAGSRPANSGGLGAPAGITCSRPRPAPRSAQPRPRLLRCSWRPRSGRSRRAAAAAG